MMDLAAIAFYGALTALAVWATWKEPNLCWLGCSLAFGFGFSNFLYFTTPIEIRPGPYTFIEVIVAVCAYLALESLRYQVLIYVIVVNIISTGINIYFASLGAEPSKWHCHAFGLGTNICFAAECLLATSAGVKHGYSTGRFDRRFYLPKLSTKSSVVSKDQS